jgi:hypothetical protein
VSVIIGFCIFLLYIWSTIKIGEFTINMSLAAYITVICGWIFGFPIVVLYVIGVL